MYFTGFADEAGAGIDTQIRATKELGWSNIELRATGFKGDIASMADADFETMAGKLADAGVKINCFGSGIANWGKSIEEPFEKTLDEVEKSVPRLKKLGTTLVRMMSYAIRRDPDTWLPLPDDKQMFEERVRRLNKFVPMFLDAGILPVHENCMTYGGMCWQNALKLVDKVPGMKLAFDTGNPIFSPDSSKKPVDGVLPRQDAWEFYDHVKGHVAYVHIKDGRGLATDKKGSIFPSGQHYTYPGEGEGSVKEIVADLIKSGYDGGISIEPHMSSVFHDAAEADRPAIAFATYVEYGRRMMAIVDAIKKKNK